MHYEFIAIPDTEIPQAVEPVFQHVVTTYASEANKTVSVWRAVPVAVSQSRTVSSPEPDATCLPSGENTTVLTSLVWPSSVCIAALQSF